MANNNAVSSTLPSRDYHCKVCDLYLDTVDSLEVHLQYHKENLYVKWGTQNAQNDSENNNSAKVKNETTVSAPADSSDNMITKPSPEFQHRATPETTVQFPHPATPQSYHSAPSPYQNPDQTNFSPGAQFGNNFPHSNFPQNQHQDQINWEQSQYNQDYHKSNRFHPYNLQERVSQVSSSSPLYGQPLNQPTPSPSPNQCDKCGFVCDSAVQLNEHCNSAHAGASAPPASSSMPFQQYAGKPYNNSGYQNDTVKIKEEHEESSDILDLDSQKVVYQGNEGEQQPATYEDTSSQVREVNTRTVPMMPWETQKMYSNPQINGDVSLFKDQKMFSEQKVYPTEGKMFHPDQKFGYTQEKFLVHHEQKLFMHVEQKVYPGVQMPPLTDYAGTVASSNSEMKPPYRPYDSPSAPQITSTQPANSTSSNLPSIGGKGANWKSNEARRPKTYNCTACNKWFTSSGHLKRHYNTTLHKNAVRSSGQPDPASMPISSHHHPSREPLQSRAQQQNTDSNTQSPIPSDDSRSVDESVMHSPYASQSFERSHRVAAMQSKSYTHLQQGNLDNNFSTNHLANHPLQHQVGSHPINIGNQPPGIGIQNDSPQGSKSTSITGANPPNGEAGPSVSQNHHMRGLLSVSTSNISAPALTQSTALTAHTLPPFSHLGVNPYSPRSTDPLGPSVPDPTHTPLYLGQNFQQTIAPSYPNGMAPHVMDMAINNLPIANPATFGESTPEEVEVMEQETNQPANGRLPSFSQLQTQSFSVYVSNYITSPNVGGQIVADESTAGYIIVDPVHSPIQYNSIDIGGQTIDYEYNYSPKTIKSENIINYNQDNVKIYPYGYAVGGKTIKREDEVLRTDSSELQILKIEDIMDYANKENYGAQMKSPASPESAKAENESHGSPSISSTVQSTPLTERNQLKKIATVTVHKCFECDKLFNKACYLTQHNKTFHSGAKPFKCDRCGKRFSDDVSYEGHYLKHADNKPFKCSECPKSFNHKTDLRRHMCLHSGCKPFACDHCGKGFIRKDHMVKHFDTHMKKNLRSSSSSVSSSSPSSST
ncbi:transcriptional regulator prz1 [Maniola jurtina]|uniref:transcriptional regulator prz1 n=1 Tax=Maniola jurtina TaxID=191418 RepID=UPI001E68B449|nr:transcriptional regulator prz1 [Maniola jurtina]